MKISRAEWVILAVSGLFLTFCVGWFAASSSRQAEPFLVTVEKRESLPDPSAAPDTAPNVPAGLINLNTATAEVLQTLPGIGEKRAADIVTYRTEYGPFARPEDVTLVPGIGEGTLTGLLDYITVSEESDP